MKTLFLYSFVFLCILHNQTIIEQNQKTLLFFMNQLLPSLFILCVFVQLLPTPKLKKNRRISLLNIDYSSFFFIVKMMLLGNPANSYLVNQLYKEKQISMIQAKRLITCVSIPSISFMLMTLPYLYNQKIAFIVFLIQILVIFLLLLFTRNISINLSVQFKEKTLMESLLFSMKTMALILAYLFVISSIQSFILIYFPQIKKLTYLLIEFSSGTNHFIHCQNPIPYLLICIGFGGFCAHLQIMSGCDSLKLNYFHYLLYRILHVILCFVIYFLFLAIIG